MFLSKQSIDYPFSNPLFGFQVSETKAVNKDYKWIVCLTKAFIIFFASFGTVGTLIDCFDLPCNLFLTGVALFFFSIILAFLHYNRIVFNIAYPVLFLIFTFFIIQLRNYVNSGFQAFTNIVYADYGTFFELSSVREVSEFVTNRELTIPITFVFLGFFLCVLLNISISTYMSTFLTVIMTLPFIQIPLYIRKVPHPLFFFFLITAYVATGILGSSGHHMIPTKKVFYDFDFKQKKNHFTYSYRFNGKLVLQIGLFSMLLAFVLILFTNQTITKANIDNSTNKLKATTDEYVKQFVQFGLASFTDRYYAKGGLAYGNLGGVSAIRPDYQTDLIVSYAPILGNESLYLKAFTGFDYTGTSWEPAPSIVDSNIGATNSEFNLFTTFLEASRIASDTSNNKNFVQGIVKIQNLDAEPSLYLPYYTVDDQSFDYISILSTPMSIGEYKETLQYQYRIPLYDPLDTDRKKDSPETLVAKNYKEYTYLEQYHKNSTLSFLYVPDWLKPTLDDVCNKIGYANTQKEQIQLVKNYFLDHYEYSQSPGSTPENADYIEHFLTKQNSGYCAHFASSAVMLLRNYGIPARYIEGYVVRPMSSEQVSVLQSEDIQNWTNTPSESYSEHPIEVEVPDANAHAWVEVYHEGFGFVPEEFTPPSSGDSEQPSFFSIFSNIFYADAPSETEQEVETGPSQNLDLLSLNKDSFLLPFTLLFLILVFVPFSYFSVKRFAFFLYRTIQFQKGHYACQLSYLYQRIVRKGIRKKLLPNYVLTPNELFAQINKHLKQPYLISDDIITNFEKACFSNTKLLHKEANRISQAFKKALWKL